MSKMNDMAQTIETLRNAATALTNAANSLAEAFTDESAAEQSEKPTVTNDPKPTITLEQVRAVLADKSRHGYTAAVKSTAPSARRGQAVGYRTKRVRGSSRRSGGTRQWLSTRLSPRPHPTAG